ncbi:MAG TPA: RagB/SusD family nutrient uptake outer membrane protein [Sphingobacteriaceae bacterium]
MKRILIFIALTIILAGCEKSFDLYPPDKLSPENSFDTEKNLQLYANSFYNILPTGNEIVRGDETSDYMAGSTISAYIAGSYTAEQAGGWGWSELRNINYFLEHFGQASIPDASKKHFEGLARFFRAWFYFEKVKQFGDVPWYNKSLDVNDPDVYKARDPRDFVMKQVLADLDFACQNLRTTKDASASQVNRWVALAFKSRVCLFEGTYRKYHTELNLNDANFWLSQAADAAKQVMQSGQYQINKESALNMSYRNLFINEKPKTNEIMLATVNDLALRVLNDANWYYTSATYGRRLSFTKSFINTFLKTDGSRFTDQADYNKIPFWNEVKGRDLRLQQTIRMGNYMRAGLAAPPDFTYTYTGYHPYKFTLDSKTTDGVAENNNSLPVIRYAEVLLNYAEAKAELGTLSSDDWNTTIKILRERAGITVTAMPVIADTYLKNTYFPGISDANLLEIRRERGIELSMEGFRYDDLMRWKLGGLLLKQYDGLYVPALNTLYDLNEDGVNDVSFVNKVPPAPVKGVVYFVINGTQHYLTEGTSGNLIVQNNLKRVFQDFMYLQPIPFSQIVLNPKLVQNTGWEK